MSRTNHATPTQSERAARAARIARAHLIDRSLSRYTRDEIDDILRAPRMVASRFWRDESGAMDVAACVTLATYVGGAAWAVVYVFATWFDATRSPRSPRSRRWPTRPRL